MFNKSFLVKRIVNSLLKRDYEVLLTHGCFDIAAKHVSRRRQLNRSRQLMLIKALVNIDSLNQQHAMSLRAVSYFMSAYPFVVSMKNNREFLNDKMVYSRFSLPVVTPNLFESILEDEAYAYESAKGRHTVVINTKALREKRIEMQFTLEELARLVGVSKKALYEIESNRVNPTERTAKRLENTLNIKLRSVYTPKIAEETRLKPANAFQSRVSKELNRIGIDNSPLQASTVEIVGKEEFSVLTALSKNGVKIKREAETVKKLSSIFSSHAFFVAKKAKEQEVEGVSVLLEDELLEVESAKELRKLIEEKQ